MAGEGNTHHSYRFGDYTLDLGRGGLFKGPEELRLRPKSFEVLVRLVEGHGRLVTREELLEGVWGHPYGSDASLTQCLIEIRRALGDKTHEVIRTVPRRGFVFEMSVTRVASKGLRTEIANTTGAPVHRSRDRVTFIAMASLVFMVLAIGIAWHFGLMNMSEQTTESSGGSIAVLPFEDMSPEGDQEYLADGIAEELINAFTAIPGLRVIARTSSFSFRGENTDIQTIADRLDVANVLEGSVRRSGDRIRVTAQLIKGETAAHLWSKTYERDLDDIFAVQREIAADVARSLHVALSDETSVIGTDVPDPEAYKHFMQARHFWERRAPGDMQLAGHHFKRAVEIDPGFARAWAGLAGYYWSQAGSTLGWEEGVRRSGEALDKALSIDPTLPEAHARAWGYSRNTGHMELAEMHAAKALQYGRNNRLVLSYGLNGRRALKEGREDLVVERLRKLQRINPLSAVVYGNAGQLLMAVGRYEEASASFEKANELNPSMTEEHRFFLAMIKVLRGRHDEAIADALRLPDSPERSQVLAKSYFALGQQAKAKEAMARLEARRDGEGAFRVAEVYGFRGNVDTAFEWLNRIPERVSDADMIRKWPPWERRLRISPCLPSLRDDPRWEPLIARMPRRPTVNAPPLEVSERLAANE